MKQPAQYPTQYPALPPPTREEEQALFARLAAGDPADRDAAREHLVHAYIALVASIARRYRPLGMELEDLIQEGVLGLLVAMDRFDPSRGHRFSTFAVHWVRQRIGRAIHERGRLIRLPVYLQDTRPSREMLEPREQPEDGRDGDHDGDHDADGEDAPGWLSEEGFDGPEGLGLDGDGASGSIPLGALRPVRSPQRGDRRGAKRGAKRPGGRGLQVGTAFGKARGGGSGAGTGSGPGNEAAPGAAGAAGSGVAGSGDTDRAAFIPWSEPLSLTASLGEDDARTLEDTLECQDPTPEQLATERALPDCIWAAIAELPDLERRVMDLRYREEMSLQEVGQRTGLSREQAAWTESNALHLLRKRLMHLRDEV